MIEIILRAPNDAVHYWSAANDFVASAILGHIFAVCPEAIHRFDERVTVNGNQRVEIMITRPIPQELGES